jgi:hypothetical protein
LSTIVTRAGKGSALTHTEMDANFTNLNNDKLQTPHTGSIEINNTTTNDSVTITTTEDSSTAAPVFTMKRNSASPADGDYLGQLKFQGENDADQEVVYAKITAKISDATDTTEDGLLEFALRKAGSNNIGARLTSSDLKLLNGTGLEVAGDIDLNGQTLTTGTGDVKITKTLMDQTHADYSLTIDNQSDTGLGLRIKAGNSDSGTHGSLAVLSVADKDNDNKFIVKASGEVVAYHNLTVHDVYINSPSSGESQISTLTSGENLNITTNSANLSLNSIKWPAADGSANQVLKTDGSGNLSFTNASGFDGDLAGSTLTDSTQGVTINSSATNRLKFENSDGGSFDGDILFNTFAFSGAIQSAMEYRTPGAYRLNKLEARGSADDGTHDAYFYLYGEDPRIISQNPTTQAYVPIELRASAVEVFNGNTYLYKLPTADGSANQVIKTDGSGTLSFTDASGFDGDLNGADLTDSGGDLTIKPNGSTNAKLKVLDNGSDSSKLQLVATSTDAVGNLVDSVDQLSNRANMTFTAKLVDFDATGAVASTDGAVRFKTGAYVDEIHFKPHQAQNKTTAIKLDTSNNTHLSGAGADSFVVEFNSQANLTLKNASTVCGQPLVHVNVTTTERNALTAAAGMVVFNTTDTKLQVYNGSTWVNLH